MPARLRKRKWSDGLPLWGLIGFGVMLLTHGKTASLAAVQALELCGTVLLPALFPFFVVSMLLGDYFPSSGLSRILGAPFQSLFHLPRECLIIPVMGAVGGYPVGAKMIAQFVREERCTRQEAAKLLMFCNNCGPAFTVSAVGAGLLHDSRLGLLLFAAHLLSAVIIGLVFSLKTSADKVIYLSEKHEEISLFPALIRAISDGFHAFLTVCAYVIFFAVVIALLRGLLPASENLLSAMLLGSLEMTTGVSLLCGMTLSPALRLSAISFLLGWGGASVQFQTVQFLRESGLSCGRYLAGKILHGCLAALIVRGLLFLFS